MRPPVVALILSATVAVAALSTVRTAAPITDAALATHLLNRLGFGPRPDSVARVMRVGALAYIDEQLHPERITDGAMTARLSAFETLTMTPRDIAHRFEAPALEARRALKAQGTPSPGANTRDITGPAPGVMREGTVPLQELAQQKLLRAVYSDRQLQEVLVDFWFNHFNVDARKGPTRFMLTEYERDVIRPHVLGRFRNLLGATAKSPAMLFYLDNWMSAEVNAPQQSSRQRRAPRTRPVNRRGLNENYGRELLELHTLGVDGGYTQQDVTEVARAFTGWTIAGPRQGGGFRFVAAWHDTGDKRVLGQAITAGGEAEGEAVLDLLAAHPATAHHVATALARRFVADAPSPALVERVASEFTRSKGDLRAVMRTLLTSPEFLDATTFRAKVKTPFDFVVSALRATGAEVSDARPVVRSLQELGMPLYQCQPPTGYKDDADAWVNTGALIARMNVALALAEGKTRGVDLADAEAATVLGSAITETTRATIGRATTRAQAIALALGAPEFQRK